MLHVAEQPVACRQGHLSGGHLVNTWSDRMSQEDRASPPLDAGSVPDSPRVVGAPGSLCHCCRGPQVPPRAYQGTHLMEPPCPGWSMLPPPG